MGGFGSFVCSDNYIMKWGNQGMPKDLDQLNNLRVIFTVCCCIIYATADEADAYMFYRCFFCFCFLFFFRSPQKYQTTVLGNG